MPIHDWTRVSAGTWHAFHLAWIGEIQKSLNAGVLPGDYYALAEQIIGPLGPDVLTLQVDPAPESNGVHPDSDEGSGGVAVAVTPPLPKLFAMADPAEYASKRRKIVIRHSSDDRIVALIELMSPGNKSSRNGFRAFVEKAAEALTRGYHLLIVDLIPPTPRDPYGVHAEIWEYMTGLAFTPPPGEPLTLVAYSAGNQLRAYIEPTAVGRELIEMPLFLRPEIYVNVPLEATYRAAFEGLPRKWRAALEAPPAGQ